MLKSTNIMIKVDRSGGIRLPNKIREVFHINLREKLEVNVDGEFIVLSKHVPQCVICRTKSENLLDFKGKKICQECIDNL